MIIDTKKLKRLVDKALKNTGVYVGMIANEDGQAGYCINTSLVRVFVKEKYADNEFKAILTAVMGCVPILGEAGQFYYCKETDEIINQDILYEYRSFDTGAERAFITGVVIDEQVAVIGSASKMIQGFKAELIDLTKKTKLNSEEDLPKTFIKVLTNTTSVLITKNKNIEIAVFGSVNEYFEEVAQYLYSGGFVENEIKRILGGVEDESN